MYVNHSIKSCMFYSAYHASFLFLIYTCTLKKDIYFDVSNKTRNPEEKEEIILKKMFTNKKKLKRMCFSKNLD